MTYVDGTCEYVLEPNNPETWGGEEGDPCYVYQDVLNKDGVWTCPHDAEEGQELCIFHLPVDEKADQEVVDSFLESVERATGMTESEEQTRELQYIGAKFGTFDLRGETLEVVIEGVGIAMHHAEIDGELNWAGSIFDISCLDMPGITCLDNATLGSVEYGCPVDFESAEFGGDADFIQAEFERVAVFKSAEFGGYADFKYTKWGEGADFRDTEFGGGVTFESAKFVWAASFEFAVFWGDTDFGVAEFKNEAYFQNAEFLGSTNFILVEIGGTADFSSSEFWGDADFESAVFEKDAYFGSAEFRNDIRFMNTEFGGDVDFELAEFAEYVNFRFAKFSEGANFAHLALDRSRFDGADLTDATLTGTNLCEANLESALLSRAILFGADLRGAKLSGTVLGDVRIDDDTKFLGPPSDDGDNSPHTISAIRTTQCCVYDPNYGESGDKVPREDIDKAKNVYRALEEIGGKAVRPRLQARCFVRRNHLLKLKYWRTAWNPDATFEERLIAITRWGRAKIAQLTMLYGESPWYILGWSLGAITLFGLIYPFGLIESTDGQLLTWDTILQQPGLLIESFFFSTITYASLGFAQFSPANIWGRLATTVEAGLGVVLIAFLIFVLGRRAAR